MDCQLPTGKDASKIRPGNQKNRYWLFIGLGHSHYILWSTSSSDVAKLGMMRTKNLTFLFIFSSDTTKKPYIFSSDQRQNENLYIFFPSNNAQTILVGAHQSNNIVRVALSVYGCSYHIPFKNSNLNRQHGILDPTDY